jgi:membrane-associated phospholipid phosphatase
MPKRIIILVILLFFLKGSLFALDFETAKDVATLSAPPLFAGLITLVKSDKEGSIQLAESFFSAEIITAGLKNLIVEKRPNGGDQSFPSGHATSAFSAAAFMHKRYGWRYGLPFYVAAGLISADKLLSNQHYVQDILAGAVIGIGAAQYFTRTFRGMTIYPIFNRRAFAVCFRILYSN